jgi:hypothetical protein
MAVKFAVTMLRIYVMGLVCMCVNSRYRNLLFEAVTEKTKLVMDKGDGVNADLKCELIDLSGNEDHSMQLDLTWTLTSFGRRLKRYVYFWYNGQFDLAPKHYHYGHFARTHGNTGPERYYLTVKHFSETFEGKYCCELRFDVNTKHENCTDVYYKRFDKREVTADCHTKSAMTDNIPISKYYPASVSVVYRNIYPRYYPPHFNTSRALELLRVTSTQIHKLANTTDFVETSKNRFSIKLTHNWTEPGSFYFVARMKYSDESHDVMWFMCNYTLRTTPPPSVQPVTYPSLEMGTLPTDEIITNTVNPSDPFNEMPRDEKQSRDVAKKTVHKVLLGVTVVGGLSIVSFIVWRILKPIPDPPLISKVDDL